MPPSMFGDCDPTKVKDPGDLIIPDEIMQKAIGILSKHAAQKPEDEWFELSSLWDLNIHTDAGLGGKLETSAAIYPVVDGRTEGGRFVEILPVKKEICDLEAVLIPSGYDWSCPVCDRWNYVEVEVSSVTCKKCGVTITASIS